MGEEGKQRVAWVDYAKGLCIFFVVMLHTTKAVEHDAGGPGWMHHVVDFARPFRMPDFFMISGLFLARTINRPWRTYLDKKVVHFAYFFLMWVVIENTFKVRSMGQLRALPLEILETWVQPHGSPLWFIYMLPVFYVLTRLVNAIPWPVVWIVAAGLQIAEIDTGILVLDQGAERFVYFYSGYVFAPQIFKTAEWFMDHPGWGVLGLLVWAGINGALVHQGVAADPGIGLLLGGAGALAVVMSSALLSRRDVAAPLRDWGQRSIVVYLAFFIPMVITKKLIFKQNVLTDTGTIAAIVTVLAVVLPLVFHTLIRNTWLRFLFERPAWATFSEATPSEATPPAG